MAASGGPAMDGAPLEDGFVRVHNPSKQRRRFLFVCPQCGWKLKAFLAKEMNMVRCECAAEFCVRRPASKPATQSSSIRPPLRSILQSHSRGDCSSDTGSHISNPSRSEQSFVVSQHSSASVVSANASVHSIDSVHASESGVEDHAVRVPVGATRIGLPHEESSGGAKGKASGSVPAASSVPGGGGSLSSILEGAMPAAWLGQIFSTTSIGDDRVRK